MQDITLNPTPGSHIYNVLEEAVQKSSSEESPVVFAFNNNIFRVQPQDTFESAANRYEEETGSTVRSPEEWAERARRDREEREQKFEEAMAATGAATEEELREADVPWFEEMDDLVEYIESFMDRPHNYGTVPYAMSMAALATFRFVAKNLGASGFQSSCADLNFLSRNRHIDGGFRIIKYEDLLYPQYWKPDTEGVFQAELDKNPQYWRDRAQEKIDEFREKDIPFSDRVLQHLISIVGMTNGSKKETPDSV